MKKMNKIFESFKETQINEFVKVDFHSHKKHNPDADTVQGQLDKDTMITYGIYVNDSEIKAGTEFMELYTGENYLPDSSKRSNSRLYSVDKIPTKYKKYWEELKSIYEKKFK